MKKTDLAYTAGIIDGEGCIYISKQSNDEWLCQWLKFTWGGSIYRIEPKKERWSIAWDWTIQTNQAYIFLKTILPYLQLKRQQAEIAIKFQEKKKRYTYKTEGETAIEEVEYLLMKNLKHNKKKEVR